MRIIHIKMLDKIRIMRIIGYERRHNENERNSKDN